VADFWPGIESGGNMDEQSIANKILDTAVPRQGTGADGKAKGGETSLRSIIGWTDAGWESPTKVIMPVLQTLISKIDALTTEVQELKSTSNTAGGTAHVKIEGDFPFTPSS
jgi:hypothetical protein